MSPGSWSRRLAAIAATLVVALLAGSSAGTPVLDVITPTDVAVDPRIVVVAFDGAFGSANGRESEHLRATYYRDIVELTSRDGAAAVGFVDFDSISFSDGAGGRTNVIASDTLQRVAVGPLHDVALLEADGALPIAIRYRVDQLASELGGIGLPVTSRSGTIRSVVMLARLERLGDGEIVSVPPFALASEERRATSVVPGFALRLFELGTGAAIAAPTPASVQIGESTVRLESGALRVRWSSRLDDISDTSIVPFRQLISGEVPDGVFRDAIVLVGATDAAIAPHVDTPVGAMSEVLVHANVLNTMLTGAHVREAWRGWAIIVAAGLVVLLVVFRPKRLRRAVGPVVAVAIGALVVARWLAGRGITTDPVVVPATLVVGLVVLGLVDQLDTVLDRRRLRSLFSQYVPATVAEQLIDSGRSEQATAGERAVITTLFCDLRGFTALAAGMEPREVRELLDLYYEVLSQVVFDHGGTVLQYTGDEIFAVFGAPMPMPDHASAALESARGMFATLDDLNRQLDEAGLPPLNFGIGIHSGEVIAAHVGSSIRRQYAVMGDTVNVGSRYCSLAREGQIMISGVAAAFIGPITDADSVGGLTMKGVAGEAVALRVQAGPRGPSGDRSLLHQTETR